jgi:Ca2+-binding RTX toxin-like protein
LVVAVDDGLRPTSRRFSRDTVSNLVVNANGGDDFVLNSTSIAGSLWGGEGNDILRAGVSAHFLFGGAGIDDLYGNSGNDRLYGGKGDDDLDGGPGIDRLFGDGGSDRLVGGPDNDFLWGGLDNDFLYGEGGADVLCGGFGNDRLEGGSDNDWLYGEGGLDVLLGQGGNDWLEGGFDGQLDELWGGDGYDTFVDYNFAAGDLRGLAESDDIQDLTIYGHREDRGFVVDGWDQVFHKFVTLDDWQG